MNICFLSVTIKTGNSVTSHPVEDTTVKVEVGGVTLCLFPGFSARNNRARHFVDFI